MINSELFQIMLEQKNLRMEKTKDEHGTFFRTQQALKTGGTVVIVISFHKSEKLIDLNIYNIATMEDNSKNEELYKLLNEVNTQLRFIKFMEKNGRVFAQYSYSIEFNYDPEITLSHIAMLLKSVESAYPKFMNL